jgi:hypothetical protein
VTRGKKHSPEEIAQREKLILGKPPRIQALTELTDEMRELAAMPAGYEKSPPTVFAILLHHIEFLRVYKAIVSSWFRLKGSLPPREHELALLRTGWLCQVPWIWGAHVARGKKAGLTSEEIERITQGSGAPGWDEYDGAILRAVEELIDDAMISDATWEILARHMEPKLLIELIALVGQYQALGYLQNSLRIPMFEDNPGLLAR